MKKAFLFAFSLAFLCSAFSQSAEDILGSSIAASSMVRQGNYTMIVHENGQATEYKTTFLKQDKDEIFPALFHYKQYRNNVYIKNVLYTGKDLVEFCLTDSSSFYRSVSKLKEDIYKDRSKYPLFKALFSSPIRSTEEFTTRLSDDIPFLNYSCYQITFTGSDNSSNKREWNIWINKKDLIPVKLRIDSMQISGQDTLKGYNEQYLKEYDFETPVNEDYLSMFSVPKYIVLKGYVQPRPYELLAPGVRAPQWKLFSLLEKKDSTSLKEHANKVVLMYFFFRGYQPSEKLLPLMQQMHMKFREHGLVVIGIDEKDKDVNSLLGFLSEMEISFDVVLGTEQLVKDYGIWYYPAAYLIDRNGKIFHVEEKLSMERKDHLEEEIKKALRKW